MFESMTEYFRQKYGRETDDKMIFVKSFISGLVGSGASNCFDFLAI